jgi:hypothetical protein
MTDQSKILDRIRKVLALAEGTNNPAEAETMMAKVQAMLDEHNFTLLDVASASDDPIGTDMRAAHCYVSNSWIKKVAGPLARLYGCRIVITEIGNKIYISISGRESGRVTWSLMLPFVLDQVKAEAKKLREADIALYGEPSVKGIGVYQRAVGNALSGRLWTMVHEQDAREAGRVANGERALVPVDLVEAEMSRAFPSLSTSRARALSTTPEARRAAANVSVHRQTGGSAAAMIGRS